MSKVMISIPDGLLARMKAMVPSRERSKVIVRLLEKEIKNREKDLFLRAKQLEESEGLSEEMAYWEKEYSEDGLKDV